MKNRQSWLFCVAPTAFSEQWCPDHTIDNEHDDEDNKHSGYGRLVDAGGTSILDEGTEASADVCNYLGTDDRLPAYSDTDDRAREYRWD